MPDPSPRAHEPRHSELRDLQPERLADLENELSRRTFVGRDSELGHFCENALPAGDVAPPVRILFVHGPGGIGKSSLLRAFARAASERGHRVVRLDCRDMLPNSDVFRAKLDQVGLTEHPESRDGHFVLLIDSYEYIRAIDSTVRGELLARVTSDTTVVLAGRIEPPAAWRSLAVWRTAIEPIKLRSLSLEDSLEYLRRRGLGETLLQQVAEFACGQPLALALAAETQLQAPHAPLEPQDAPHLISTLAAEFLRGADPGLRSALEACALVRSLTEEALGSLFPDGSASRAFEWLRRLEFMELAPHGIFPHDVARDVILADLKWRNPAAFRDLQLRLKRYHEERIVKNDDAAAVEEFAQIVFSTRYNPKLKPFFETPADLAFSTDLARPSDLDALERMTERYEGPTVARLLRHWYSHQPDTFLVARNPAGEVIAFVANLRLDRISASERDLDPAIERAFAWIEKTCGRLPRGQATHSRFWMARDGYQSLVPEAPLCAIMSSQPLIKLPELSFAFEYFADWPLYCEAVTYAGAKRIPDADFEIDGRRYAVAVHDRRGISAAESLRSISERSVPGDWTEVAPAPIAEELLSLEQGAFASAVRSALRALHDDVQLSKNPLLDTRALAAGLRSLRRPERAAALRQLLTSEIESQRGKTKGDRVYQALKLTYLNPAPSQEKAAELLGEAYSTFRRHLSAGVERIVASLWSRETADD